MSTDQVSTDHSFEGIVENLRQQFRAAYRDVEIRNRQRSYRLNAIKALRKISQLDLVAAREFIDTFMAGEDVHYLEFLNSHEILHAESQQQSSHWRLLCRHLGMSASSSANDVIEHIKQLPR